MSSKSPTGYSLSVDPISGETTASRDCLLLAKSTNAKVMHETRLPPVVYFPIDDLKVPVRDNTDVRTFCPFKGTARYFDLRVEGEWLERAAWHYPKPLPESRAIDGYVAFVPQVATAMDPEPEHLLKPQEPALSGPLVEWILREAGFCRDAAELTGALGRELNEHGVIVSRLSVMIWSLHPLTAGQNHIWQRNTGEVKTYTPDYGILDNPAFVNSPLRHVSDALGGVRQRLDSGEPEFKFPIIDDLRREGATDYVAMPLIFSGGQVNVLTLTCDHPGGFTTANLGLIFEMSAAIARYYEVFVLQDNARAILQTYVGARTADRVLGGEIRRGDGDDIDAAILIADLRNSSLLEQKLGRKAYLDLLNAFFEECETIIGGNGGELLKFIGDAVLAVFPADDDVAEACHNAASAARGIADRMARPLLGDGTGHVDCAIGVAFGEVTYGNVGSRGRLDFTVIGKATNIAARLSDHCKSCGNRIVVSREIADHVDNSVPLGALELKNV
ncbi:MAG: DUF427 domain-containing protein, partial [Rhizobiaceae bacterium]